jgi:hypothetical protein
MDDGSPRGWGGLRDAFLMIKRAGVIGKRERVGLVQGRGGRWDKDAPEVFTRIQFIQKGIQSIVPVQNK